MPSIVVALHGERPIAPTAVRALYALVGWWPERDDEQIGRALEAGPAAGAWDGLKLVGFARAVTDSAFRAYVEDVVVDPGYQHTGVGTLVLRRLLDSLGDVDLVSLFCKAQLVPFYEAFGFRAWPSQMVLHRKSGAAAIR